MELDFQRNINTSIKLIRWILKPIGVWPSSSKLSKMDRYVHRLVNLLCYGLMLFLLAPCFAYVILDVETTYLKIKMTGPLSFFVMAIVKYYWLILHSEDIRRCIEYIETDWKSVRHVNDKSIMIENANFGNRLIIICGIFMFGGDVFFNFAVPFRAARLIAKTENVSFIPLVYPPPSVLIDSRRSPVNEIFFSIQCVTSIVGHATAVGACSLATVFATHACGQMEVLMSWLEHLVDGREDLGKDVNGRLADVVNKHVRILSFLALTEKVLQKISLVEVFGCTLNMCLLGYYCIMEWGSGDITVPITYATLLVSLTFNIFIFCYVGELVTEQCERVGTSSYMTEWYRLPGKKNLDIILMIAMSNSSVKLTAGNIIELSLSSFGDVVKAAVTYLNMLRTLTS